MQREMHIKINIYIKKKKIRNLPGVQSNIETADLSPQKKKKLKEMLMWPEVTKRVETGWMVQWNFPALRLF